MERLERASFFRYRRINTFCWSDQEVEAKNRSSADRFTLASRSMRNGCRSPSKSSASAEKLVSCTRSGDMIYVFGFPPFDLGIGKVIETPIECQTELVLEQMKLCLETAGSSLENVLKCNVYCTSVEKFAAVNAIYARYFPKDPPARIFVCVPAWPGPFDVEVDCIAVRKDG